MLLGGQQDHPSKHPHLTLHDLATDECAKHSPHARPLSLPCTPKGTHPIPAAVKHAVKHTELQSVVIPGDSFRSLQVAAITRGSGVLGIKASWIEHLKASDLHAILEKYKGSSELTTIEISNCCLDAGCVKTLMQFATHWPELQDLELGYNDIGKEGARILGQSGSTWSNLTKLFLNRNAIGDDGVRALAQAGHHWPELQVLGLEGNHITETGARYLAEYGACWSKLTMLSLDDNCIKGEGATALAERASAWPQLQRLYLRDNSIGDEGVKALAKAGSNWPQLKELCVGFKNICDEGAKVLVSEDYESIWPVLETLWLRGNAISEVLMQSLIQHLITTRPQLSIYGK
eukprot:jgi/Chrzof1/6170/Cz17g14050.t1